jgi:hypothetical protein
MIFNYTKFFLLACALAFSAAAKPQTTWNISPGWNLLGNGSIGSLEVRNPGLNNPTQTTSVWAWNNSTGKWAFFSPSLTSSELTAYAQSNGYDVLDNIASKQGFWVNAAAAYTITSPWNNTATLVGSDIKVGWNLVSGSSDKTSTQLIQSLQQTLSSSGIDVASMWAWDRLDSTWKFYSPSLEKQGGSALTDYINTQKYKPFPASLEPSEGVWINASSITSTKPIAAAIYPSALNKGAFVLDASPSFSPLGRPLSYTWSVISIPSGNRGISYSDQAGRIGIHIGEYSGDYILSLSVSDGEKTSDPLRVEVKVCCNLKTPVATWSKYAATLPTYTKEYIQGKWDAESGNMSELAHYFRFAATYALSSHHLDWLLGYPPLTIQNADNLQQYSKLNFSPPNGGATILGFETSIPNTIQVNSDITKISYPTDFSKARAANTKVSDPFCSVNPPVISMRAEDLGSYSLPQIRAKPLPSTSIKLAHIKDIWTLVYPNSNCARDPIRVIDATLDRLSTIGVNAISITPWAIFSISSSGVWKVTPAGDIPGSEMSDEDIGYVVAQAHKRGMKVYWRNQIQIARKSDQSVLLPNATTLADVTLAMDAMTSYLQERATTLQSLGVDGINIGPWYWVNFETYFSKETFVAKFSTTIKDIRSRFSGKIVLDLDDFTIDPLISSQIDYYLFSKLPIYNSTSIIDLSVADMSAQMKAAFSPFVGKLGGKPVILDVGPQSREGFYTFNSGYFDPFCTPNSDSLCPQLNMRGDYSAQAIWYEAELETFVDNPDINLGGLSVPYILLDNLLPSAWFPNIDATVRLMSQVVV